MSNELSCMKWIREEVDNTEVIIKWKGKWALVMAELRKRAVARGIKIRNQRLTRARLNS